MTALTTLSNTSGHSGSQTSWFHVLSDPICNWTLLHYLVAKFSRIVKYKVGVLALISHHKLEYTAYLPAKAQKKYEIFSQGTPDTRGGVSKIEGSN